MHAVYRVIGPYYTSDYCMHAVTMTDRSASVKSKPTTTIGRLAATADK